jgi:glycosidase
VRSCTVTLKSSDADAVTGEFTDWEETPLEEGKLELEDLEPGEYAYAFVTDGEIEDGPPRDVYSKWFDGTEYRNLRVGDCNTPTWEVVEAGIEDGTLTAELEFVSAAGGAKLDPTSVVVEVDGQSVSVSADPDSGTVAVSKKLDEPNKYTLTATATDSEGVEVAEELWLPLWYDEGPEWTWQDALLYLVFTDRFRDSDGEGASDDTDVATIAAYQGGDFQGITRAIEEGYFEELGVNALWLSPIYDNPDGGFIGQDGENLFMGYHGYWPIDSLTAEPRFGGDQALHELIDAAHERGIRIVFDIVLNHVHEDHSYCADDPEFCSSTCVCGSNMCGWEEKPVECQFAPYLPDLDYRNHAIVQQVVADVMQLVRKFDVDALRIDAAKHMNHVIMRTLRLRTRELEEQGAAPFWLIGETFTFDRGEIMRYVNDSELHGQFDFPLFGAIRSVFAQGGSFRDLEGAAAAGQHEYGPHYKWMSPFLGNHDVERFATLWAGNSQGGFGQTPDLMAEGTDEVTQWDLINRMSMGFAFLLTQPGIPLIYYGDEVGLAGAGDPDNRRMMPTALNANRQELLGRVQELGKLRREIRALRHGSRKELWLDDDVYVYVRDAGPGEAAIVAMNKGAEPRTVEVQIPNALGLTGATFESRNSDRSMKVIDGVVSLSLDPWEYAIFTPE